MSSNDTLSRLAAVIESRKIEHGGDPDKSYVARLLHKGPDAFLKKIGEEATETVMAAKDLDHGGQPQHLVNEFALSTNKPWIYGAAVGSYGITMPVIPGVSACLQCLYPEPPKSGQPTCETAGVLGSITATIAALQTADAIKLLSGHQPRLRITTIDVWNGSVRQIDQPPRDTRTIPARTTA